MTTLDDIAASLPGRLSQLAGKHGIVGATLAVQQGDRIVECVHGVTNLNTGVEVTPDTIFQIGSITKVYTATLVMQLVDEGLVDLDAPITTYLPDFTLADPDAASRITVRQLLSHTSGIDGDVFDDFGRGDECVERYVEAMSGLDTTSPPGAFFSYCNAGYVLLARLIEELRKVNWDTALRTHLLEPLGVTDTVTLPEEAILRRAAVGHLPTGENGASQLAPVWFMSRAIGPAGVISASGRELLAFARMHLDDGRAANGNQVLSAASAKAMRQLVVTLPEPRTLGDAWGLGWILPRVASPTVIGHDGSTIGQQAYLKCVPDADLSIALLTNGGKMGGLYNELVRALLVELGSAELPAPATPPAEAPSVDISKFLGTYERSGVRFEITQDVDGAIWMSVKGTGPLAASLPDEPPRRLVALDDRNLVSAEPEARLGQHVSVAFLEPGPAGFGYLHSGGRATPRQTG